MASKETAQKIRYDALIAHEYGPEDDRKTHWTRVGAGFSNADGKGINIELTPGIAVNGRLVLRVHEPKAQD
ncbi:hypothetical protein [Pseudomonas aeruginosa]|jgi:hypothetical protein|uniref:hypothetical protein n=1 Tax=Pseudomonas aeruginosa TaxID=287 RepID=UPI000500A931|nr:hypothetical protein [Pseudomonas aeruginosa]KFJ91935.1 hypothetical protein JF55_09940 [Pseudomonas sp. 1-7]WRS37829.1 hypothetical protein U9S62_33490 [Pseudomonas aeruginosa]